MITLAIASEAPRIAQKQRLSLAKLLTIDESKATAEDLVLARKVIAAGKGDGAAYDKALANAAVAVLFRRGVLHFGEIA